MLVSLLCPPFLSGLFIIIIIIFRKQDMASASSCCGENEWAVHESRRVVGGDPVQKGAGLTHEQASV